MTANMDVLQALQEKFGDAVSEEANIRDELTIVVDAPQIVEVCRYLHDTAGLDFKYLSDITGVDYYPAEPRFALCYHVLSLSSVTPMRLKVYWSDGDAPVPSVTGVWQSANWEEREAADLMGIEFSGHPDLRRLLMPDDWQGHPQRKDYPLGYETVQFSFNFDEINRHKPFAKE